MLTVRALSAWMGVRQWFAPRRRATSYYPGRRITVRVGHMEIERMFGSTGRWPTTGERMRRAGWIGPNMDRVRLSVPWVGGCLMVMVAE